jgi:polysaccharide biosynthesis transport protein
VIAMSASWRGEVSPPRYVASPDHLELHDVFRILRRRKRVIVLTVLLLTCLSAVLAYYLPRLYTASAKLLIEPHGTNVVDSAAVVDELPLQDQGMIETQIEFLTSRSFLSRVVEKLSLADDVEFNPFLIPTHAGTAAEESQTVQSEGLGAPPPRSLIEQMQTYAERGLTAFAKWELPAGVGVWASPAQPPLAAPEDVQEAVVDELLKRVSVEQPKNAYVIDIGATSEQPEKAAEIANAVASLYVSEQLQRKQSETSRAAQWLKVRVKELRKELIKAEQKVAQYRKEQELIEDGGSSPVMAQLSQLNTHLTLVQTERAEAEARLARAQALLAKGEGVAEFLTSPLLGSLRGEEATLARRRAELAAIYGERHPQMLNLEAEFRELRQRMTEEARRIIGDLANEVEVARTREEQLGARIDALGQQISERGRATVQLKGLEHDAEATQNLYTTLLKRLKEVEEQQEIIEADSRVISPAIPPLRPSFPQPWMMIGAGFAGSLMLSAILAFIAESLDKGVRDRDRIERLTGLRTLAFVPKVSGQTKKRPLHHQLLQHPRSAFSAAVRSVQMDLMLYHGQELRVVLVTSSLPEEGKTSLVLTLGAAAATAGYRTAMLDLDLHHPSLRGAIRQPSEGPGLSEFLSGEHSIDDIIYTDSQIPNLHAITVGRSPHDPTRLLASPRLPILIEQLRARFDFVVLDTPPVLAVKDVQILTRLADATILVVRWQTTKEDAVRASTRMLADKDANLAGAVLNQVNLKRHAKAVYGDPVQYEKQLRRYYCDS